MGNKGCYVIKAQLNHFFNNPSAAHLNVILVDASTLTLMYVPGHQTFAFDMKFQ